MSTPVTKPRTRKSGPRVVRGTPRAGGPGPQTPSGIGAAKKKAATNAALEDLSPIGPRELREFLSGYFGRGRPLLERLLTDPNMQRAWKEIEKRYRERYPESDSAKRRRWYRRLLTEIRSGHSKALKPEPSPAKVRDSFGDIARDARALAAQLAHTENGAFDLPTYEFFPADTALLAFPDCDWPALNGADRASRASEVLEAEVWPSMPQMLTELARRAEERAAEAMVEKRFTQRSTRDRQATHFLRYMAEYFRESLGGPLEGTLARIASVVFDKPIHPETVKRALRSGNKGGA